MKTKYLAALTLMMCACTSEEEIPVEDAAAGRRIGICCHIGETDPKSEYEGENPDSPVRRIHLMAYTSGKLDAEYSASGSKAEMELYEDRIYDIYALVNTEKDEFTAPLYESGLADIGFETSTAGLSRRGGIPMAGKISIMARPDATVYIPCRRLFARYRISLTGSGAEFFEASSIRITGVSQTVMPFGTDRASVVTDGDSATTRDILDFNSGREIVFHIPENMQGDSKGPLCTGVHISGRIRGYDGGGNAVYGYDRKISYDYILKDSDGLYNVSGNSDYTSVLQLSRYGWTLSDEQATLEEGSECMHYLFFCDQDGKPLDSADIPSDAAHRTVRVYYRTDLDNVAIGSDKSLTEGNLELTGSAIHCGGDIYCNEYRNSYSERQNDFRVCFSATYAGNGFGLNATADYRFEGCKSDFGIVSDSDVENLYIAQVACLTVNGGEGDQWQWSTDRPASAVLLPNGNSCRVECHGAGQVLVSASNGHGQTVSRMITIWKPAISFIRSSMILPLDGTGIDVPFMYVNRHGNHMSDDMFDKNLKERLLAPQFVPSHAINGRAFYKCSGNQLYVSTLSSYGTSIMALDKGDGSAHLGYLTHPETTTLANASQYGCDSDTTDIYAIVPETDFSREYQMLNYHHVGGAVSNVCPEQIYIPYAGDLGIRISSDVGADLNVDGDYIEIGWPVNYDLCGHYTVNLFCSNFRDGSSMTLGRIDILVTMYLGIRMASVKRDGIWWLVPVAYDESTGLFPADTEIVSWNRDSEYIDNVDIVSSERKWGLHRNQIDGGLCISRCEQYFGTVRPALPDGSIIDCSKYHFTLGSELRALSESYEILDVVPGDDYVKIIDMTR